jgi:hypothetical protein
VDATLRVEGGKRLNGLRPIVLLACAAGCLAIKARDALGQEDLSCKPEIQLLRNAKNAKDSLRLRTGVRVCTENDDEASRQRRLDRTNAEALRLAKMFFDLPEYHDEGRLPVGRDRTDELLGPVTGIYASPFLYGFTRPAQIYEQGTPGTLAALVVVDARPDAILPPSYTNLHLRAGMNCVWLYVNPPPAGTRSTDSNYLARLSYVASVSHPGPSGDCDRSARMYRLHVVAVRNARFPDETNYPSVARFDTDQQGNPIMAFKCLNAFCEVGVRSEQEVRGPDNLVRRDAARAQWNPKAGANPDEARQQVIKGWHDEQTLAVRGTDFKWRASNVRATIRPDPTAAHYDSADFHDNWRRVATVEINEDVPTDSKYFGWGLRKGANDIEFQYASAVGRWQARLVRSGSQPKPWKFMVRHVHRDVAVPPIVRFRWTGADDGVWAPCGNACCKTDDGT